MLISESNGDHTRETTEIREGIMYNIFYIIGLVVVVLAILGYFGFR